ncbi:aminoglycoside phosphotransferase family protein [Actinopolymorpha pittospori]|uniref:Streptomycin 6-kinase n=1 Tax=Actinopolymorpha pittospori TaxID=648752 RepID=A0A927N5N5_9ACTN|nr:aminoglycoside phosphotransferase family protein [Actinopolymorpha pittospori]MBE1612564.1 streptomycin 6-kinase [Actinopolymorpha pittospori]
MVEIPAAFVRTTIEREGDPGRTWVASLPGLVDEFLQRWGCIPAAPIRFGQVGIILPVQRHDGAPAVLKISFTHPGNMYEAHALAAWDGRGAVRLYERDDARFAMLLEQAEWKTLDDLGDVDQATAVTGQLARRLAVPAPPDLPRLSDRAEEWERTLGEDAAKLGHRLSQRALGAALATIQDLGRKQPDTMVHGDLHFGNIVRAEREPWLVVDPKGCVGDLAFDASRVLVRGVDSLREADDLEAELRRRLAIFSDAAEIERERAIRWLQVDAAMGACRGIDYGEEAWVVSFLVHVAELLA